MLRRDSQPASARCHFGCMMADIDTASDTAAYASRALPEEAATAAAESLMPVLPYGSQAAQRCIRYGCITRHAAIIYEFHLHTTPRHFVIMIFSRRCAGQPEMPRAVISGRFLRRQIASRASR